MFRFFDRFPYIRSVSVLSSDGIKKEDLKLTENFNNDIIHLSDEQSIDFYYLSNFSKQKNHIQLKIGEVEFENKSNFLSPIKNPSIKLVEIILAVILFFGLFSVFAHAHSQFIFDHLIRDNKVMKLDNLSPLGLLSSIFFDGPFVDPRFNLIINALFISLIVLVSYFLIRLPFRLILSRFFSEHLLSDIIEISPKNFQWNNNMKTRIRLASYKVYVNVKSINDYFDYTKIIIPIFLCIGFVFLFIDNLSSYWIGAIRPGNIKYFSYYFKIDENNYLVQVNDSLSYLTIFIGGVKSFFVTVSYFLPFIIFVLVKSYFGQTHHLERASKEWEIGNSILLSNLLSKQVSFLKKILIFSRVILINLYALTFLLFWSAFHFFNIVAASSFIYLFFEKGTNLLDLFITLFVYLIFFLIFSVDKISFIFYKFANYVSGSNNRKFVLNTLRSNGKAFKYATDELKNDREFVLEVVKINGWALQFASEEFSKNREFILEAVKSNGGALQFVSEEFLKDREIVLKAVKSFGYVLHIASAELKNDREIVSEAIKSYYDAFQFASEELQEDPEIIKIYESVKSKKK